MGMFKALKKTFDFGTWAGGGDLRRSTNTLKSMYQRLNKRAKGQDDSAPKLSGFEEYVKYYQLTEKDLRQKNSLSKVLAYVYSGCSLGLAAYMFYQMWAGHFWGTLICLVFAVLLFLYGLREQMRCLQIEKRSLNISMKESFFALLTDRKMKNENKN